jgi:hypothetical protein
VASSSTSSSRRSRPRDPEQLSPVELAHLVEEGARSVRAVQHRRVQLQDQVVGSRSSEPVVVGLARWTHVDGGRLAGELALQPVALPEGAAEQNGHGRVAMGVTADPRRGPVPGLAQA